ncbi:MAG: hypothetical protein OEM01_04855 [Desulfobulbaceae bacterium]|nr:hypothetical protein [Desulfobulbaceae bacterium]
MQKIDQVQRIMRFVTMFVIAFVLVIGPGKSGWTAEATTDNYLEKARLDAIKAKADAEKAMAEAEKAMVEAEAVIEKAEAARTKASGGEEHAMEKMVSAGYFPDDITLSDAEGKSTAVFSHKKHTAREKLKCIECHPKVFIMKVDDKVVKGGQLTMAEMKKGRYCGCCHNGQKAFSVSDVKSCRRCHPRQ